MPLFQGYTKMKFRKKYNILTLILVSFSLVAAGQSARDAWVDSVMNRMSLDDRIAQLLVVPVSTNDDGKSYDLAIENLSRYAIGGVVFAHSSPVCQANATNNLQEKAQVPLLVGAEVDYGLQHAMDSVLEFPDPVILGAVQNDTLLRTLGKLLGQQLHLLGVNLNFAPTVNAMQPASRDYGQAFSDNSAVVAAKSVAFVQGMQEAGILTCAKFFPITGLTVSSVQKNGIPNLTPSTDSLQIYVFQKLIEEGITGIMPASSAMPAVYTRKNLAKKNKFSSRFLSAVLTGNWVQQNYRFSNGLIYADLPSTVNRANKLKPGDAGLIAFLAGNDVILFPDDINATIKKIRKEVRSDPALEDRLNNSVRRILNAKYNAGLNEWKKINTDNLIRKLNSPAAIALKQRLLEQAITVVRNDRHLLPIKELANHTFASVTLGDDPADFVRYLNKYTRVDAYQFSGATPNEQLNQLIQYDRIIIGLFPGASLANVKRLLENLPVGKIILCDFTLSADPDLYVF